MGVQRMSTVQGLHTTTNWGMSSSPPADATHNVVRLKLSKGRTATLPDVVSIVGFVFCFSTFNLTHFYSNINLGACPPLASHPSPPHQHEHASRPLFRWVKGNLFLRTSNGLSFVLLQQCLLRIQQCILTSRPAAFEGSLSPPRR
jgi:hypothetical protein